MDNVTKIFRLNSNFGILNKLVTALEVPLTFTCQGTAGCTADLSALLVCLHESCLQLRGVISFERTR
jgi:hypothetical protein